VVCPCEGVDAGALRAAIAAGDRTMRDIGLATRLGMGPCQGRLCGPAAALMLDAAAGGGSAGRVRARMPVHPVPVRVLADAAAGGPSGRDGDGAP